MLFAAICRIWLDRPSTVTRMKRCKQWPGDCYLSDAQYHWDGIDEPGGRHHVTTDSMLERRKVFFCIFVSCAALQLITSFSLFVCSNSIFCRKTKQRCIDIVSSDSITWRNPNSIRLLESCQPRWSMVLMVEVIVSTSRTTRETP